SEHIETPLGQPDCVRAGTCADLKRPPRHDAARIDELDQQRLRHARVPGRFSRGVGFVPRWMGHTSVSLTWGVSQSSKQGSYAFIPSASFNPLSNLARLSAPNLARFPSFQRTAGKFSTPGRLSKLQSGSPPFTDNRKHRYYSGI